MINLTPVTRFSLDDLRSGTAYAGDATASDLIAMTYHSYFICDDDEKLGFLGLHKPGCLSNRGLLWMGLYPSFRPTRQLLRDAKRLGETFFSYHRLDICAEVSCADKAAINFVKYFGMVPDIHNDTVQLYVRKI
jgi:hypothetical protein|tara:strand:- start:3941 stop:4342 length:402 start_codon:yes stop_codon:yes gene_type:complete